MRQDVDRQNGSYRQGLILGLTMAELLLLLVFCLLIALAALLADAKLKLDKAEEELAATRTLALSALDEARREALATPPQAVQAAAVQPGAGTATAAVAPASGAAVDDTWDRLVAADRTVARLKAAGIDPEAMAETGDTLAALRPLVEGAGPERVLADVALADALRERLGVAADAPLDADQVAAFVAESRDQALTAARRLLEAERQVAALQESVAALTEDAAAAREAAEIAEAEMAAAAARAANLVPDDVVAARDGRAADLPPIITLKEREGFLFETGSAVLGPAFADRLTGETAARLRSLVDRYDVDVIEVVGHTDERPVARNTISNLDGALIDVVRGGGTVEALVPADNAGLGLARAVAVARVLAADPRLAGLDVLPLSAGPLVGTDGRLIEGATFADVAERRRIEIRLRRSGAPAG